jgi:hypothetical protein
MSAERPRKEHRASTRPRSGDLRVCPFCRAGSIVFNETHDDDEGASPAWVCENPSCGYRVLVRKSPKRRPSTGKNSVETSHQLNARARRVMMKSTARVDRTLRRIDRMQERHNKTK